MIVVLVVCAAVITGGVFAFRRLGEPTGEDVGGLAALRPVQDQLAALPACGIRYRNHQRSPRDKVLIEACEDVRFPTTAWISVPAGWTYDAVRFQATRARVGAPWQIFVDKDQVALDELSHALTALVPVLTTQGIAELAQQRAAADAYERGRAERERTERERAEQARRSYDAK